MSKLKFLAVSILIGAVVFVLAGMLESEDLLREASFAFVAQGLFVTYSVLGVAAALIIAFLLTRMAGKRSRSDIPPAYLAVVFSLCVALTFLIICGDYLHETYLASVGFWQARSILMSFLLLVSGFLAWIVSLVLGLLAGKVRVVRWFFYVVVLAILSVGVAQYYSTHAATSDHLLPTNPIEHDGVNVLLITVDTLRCDHLGCYGYERGTSSNIDALAQQGIIFRTAISQSPWTLPSLASIMTGLNPSSHGAGEIFWKDGDVLETKMFAGAPTVAKCLLEKGYETAAFVTGFHASGQFGLSQGFKQYYNAHEADPYNHLSIYRIGEKFLKLEPDLPEDTSPDVTQRAINWLASNYTKPFFLWVHYFDPHEYLRYHKNQPASEYSGVLRDLIDKKRISEEDLRYGTYKLSRKDIAFLEELYDANIEFTDWHVGRLLEAVEKLALEERTLVIFTSDHGEEFAEHGGFGHGNSTYDELIRVPLIVKLPGTFPAGVVCESLVRLVDIAPTILEVTGNRVEWPLQGKSLLCFAAENINEAPRVAFAEYLRYFDEQKCIRDAENKLILFPASGSSRYFNLQSDAKEQNGLNSLDSAVAAALVDRLHETMDVAASIRELYSAGSGATAATLDETTRQRLQSLGYVN